MDLLIQLIGGAGIVASILSFQCKKHRHILLFRTLNELIFAIQYFLLGAYTGMVMNLIGCVRNTVFEKQVSRGKKSIVSSILFSGLFLGFGVLFWQGPVSILIIIAKIVSTFAYGNKNTTVLRGLILVTSTMWLIYNYSVFSIAGVLCETFTLLSLIIGVIRFDLIPRITSGKTKRQ